MGQPASDSLRLGLLGVWVLGLLLGGVSPGPASQVGHPGGGEALLARVQERYERTRQLRARFRQETRLQGFDQVQSGEGRVWVLKPGMMRWDYTSPERQTIIANGETLWVYLPAERQVIRDQLQHSFGTRTPALFLAGEARLTELFTVTGGAPLTPSEDGLLRLELTPTAGALPYVQVQLGIDPSSHLVHLVRLLDALGHSTTMWFSDIDTAGAVEPSLFQFQVPPGVEVLAPPVFPVPR